MISFDIRHTDGRARHGLLKTPSGHVPTPTLMPVGTAGTVKGLTPAMVRDTGATMILANTYHLLLRPGPDTVAALGGLHELTGWTGPILTDSGGYQVFSLAHRRRLDDDGVTFRSHVDGAAVRLTPAGAIEIQHQLGADIIMQLDVCPPAGAPREAVAAAVERSAAWAGTCADTWTALDRRSAQDRPQSLFGIQQGGVFPDLRAASARRIVDLDLDGYAVGGVSVGEGHAAMIDVLEPADDILPRTKPRYLMGVGEPRDVVEAVRRGIDLFDCVMPTRNGRNAQAFTADGRIRLRNAANRTDGAPIERGCDCYACRTFSRGAIRHFFNAGEMIGPMLVSLHNLRFFAALMRRLREAIAGGGFDEAAAAVLRRFYGRTEFV